MTRYRDACLSYLKGVALLPFYVKRTYDLARFSRQNPKAEMEARHAAIYEGVARREGIRQSDRLTIDGITVRIHPPRVIETVNEVILRDDYGFRDDEGPFVMIDVGMNVAITAISKARNPKFTRVYGFEPLRPTYDIAVSNIGLNPAIKDKITTYNFGLSDRDQELRVNYTLDEIMSISSEGTFDSCFAGRGSEEAIRVRRAADVLGPIIESHPKEKIFLKVDCEGAEFKIIPDLDRAGLLRRVTALIIEWHNREPQDLLEILARNGFFYFTERINVEWNVGIIRAVATGPRVLL